MLQLSKHAGLSFSHLICFHLSQFLQAHAEHSVRIMQYSAKWSGLPGEQAIKDLTALHQPIIFPIPPPHLITHKRRAAQRMYVHWEEELDKRNEFASCIPPPSSVSL
jgi:hypothetical protein